MSSELVEGPPQSILRVRARRREQSIVSFLFYFTARAFALASYRRDFLAFLDKLGMT